MMRVCRVPPKQHDRATLADEPRALKPRPPSHNPARTRAHADPTTTTPQQHPAYMRARARPNSRARALPTNRHKGGSLT